MSHDPIDQEVREFYGEQALPEDTLSRLVAMAESDPASAAAPHAGTEPAKVPWRWVVAGGGGTLLAAAASVMLTLSFVSLRTLDVAPTGAPVATTGSAPRNGEGQRGPDGKQGLLESDRSQARWTETSGGADAGEGKTELERLESLGYLGAELSQEQQVLSGEEGTELVILGGPKLAENTAIDGDVDGRYANLAINEPPPREATPRERDYGRNPVVKTAEDAVSTFAIDVDTASFTRTRAALDGGHLPSAASVRVEEFVNYLPYEYRRPTAGEPFSVDAEAVASPWSQGKEVVRIGVQGRTVTGARKPVHLTFLVDTSGSMARADKLDLVKWSLLQLTEELEDGDTIALVTYAGQTSVRLAPTDVADLATIRKAVEGLSSSGSTAMGAGIDLAYAQAEAAYVDGAVNRVILCSDGDANVGITNPDVLASRLRVYAERGITLTTLGFGVGAYNDTTMERLANQGDGNYFFIDDRSEARRVLVDKLTGTLEVIAKDVKIQVEWDPEVVSDWRLVGYENRHLADEDFRDDRVDAGEIGAGHRVTALYEITRRRPGALGSVSVRSKAPGPDAPAVERAYSLPESSVSEASANTEVAVVMAGFADKLRGADVGSWSTLVAQAREAVRAEYEEDAEMLRLIERAAELSGE